MRSDIQPFVLANKENPQAKSISLDAKQGFCHSATVSKRSKRTNMQI